MHSASAGKRLTIYVGESDSWRGRSLYMSILETLRQNGIAGATVVRGQAGFGAHSLIHTWRIERLSMDLPMIIIVVDTPENIERALALVRPMVREGLITLEDIEIVKYTHRYLHPLPADLPVSAVMTRQVLTVSPDAPALEVIELLLGKLFKAVPVVDARNRVVGIITETDLLEKAGMPARLAVAGRLEEEDLRAFLGQIRREKTAQDIMTAPVVTARTDEALGHVVQRMLERGLRRLPVTDANGKLMGMISRVDVLRAAAGTAVAEEEEAAPRAGNTLGEVMIPQVPTVRTSDDLVDVLQQMLQGRFTYVVVLDEEGHPVGVITEGDLVARVAPPVRGGVLQALARRMLGREVPRGDVFARDIMSERALTAPPEMSVTDGIALMLREGRKRIVVTDADGRPLGLVDRQALLAASLGEQGASLTNH